MKILFLTLVLFSLAQVNNKCDGGDNPKANKNSVSEKMSNKAVDATRFDRLPEGVNLTDQVRKDVYDEKGEITSTSITTVEEELKNLGARYSGDKLIDRGGREIKFFTPLVRGISEGFEDDQRQQRDDQHRLAALRRNFTVIVLYVDPRKVM